VSCVHKKWKKNPLSCVFFSEEDPSQMNNVNACEHSQHWASNNFLYNPGDAKNFQEGTIFCRTSTVSIEWSGQHLETLSSLDLVPILLEPNEGFLCGQIVHRIDIVPLLDPSYNYNIVLRSVDQGGLTGNFLWRIT